jgi:hypothetical protein
MIEILKFVNIKRSCYILEEVTFFWDMNKIDWKSEKGMSNVMIGASIVNIKLKGSFDYEKTLYTQPKSF